MKQTKVKKMIAFQRYRSLLQIPADCEELAKAYRQMLNI